MRVNNKKQMWAWLNNAKPGEMWRVRAGIPAFAQTKEQDLTVYTELKTRSFLTYLSHMAGEKRYFARREGNMDLIVTFLPGAED